MTSIGLIWFDDSTATALSLITLMEDITVIRLERWSQSYLWSKFFSRLISRHCACATSTILTISDGKNLSEKTFKLINISMLLDLLFEFWSLGAYATEATRFWLVINSQIWKLAEIYCNCDRKPYYLLQYWPKYFIQI